MMLVRNNSTVAIVIKLAGVPKVFPSGVYEYSDDILKFPEFRKGLEIYPCLSVLPKHPSDTATSKVGGITKRGRPRFENFQGSLEVLKSLYPNIKTRRGLQNKYFEIKAIKAIKDMEGMEFLFDSKTGNFKSSILAEIGRTGNDEIIREVAAEVCRRASTEKRTVKQWVYVCHCIREVLLGRHLTEDDNLGSGFLNRKEKKHKT